MIRLDGKNAAGSSQIRLAGDCSRGAVIRGNADVLEDECTEQEILFVQERVECLVLPNHARRTRQCGETRRKVQGRTRDGGTTERCAKKQHVVEFVIGDFLRVLKEILVGKSNHLAAASDYARVAAHAGALRMPQTVPVDGVEVEFGLEIFEVQCEVQDVSIGERVGLYRCSLSRCSLPRCGFWPQHRERAEGHGAEARSFQQRAPARLGTGDSGVFRADVYR